MGLMEVQRCRNRTGSATQGLRFYAALVGPNGPGVVLLRQPVDVAAVLGRIDPVAQRRTVHLNGHGLDIVHFQEVVWRSGIHKPATVLCHGQGGVRKVYRHPAICVNVGFMMSISCLKATGRPLKKRMGAGKMHRTARTIATQTAKLSVGIVVIESKITLLAGP